MKNAIYKQVLTEQSTLINQYRALINLGMYNDRLTVLTEQSIEYFLNDAYYKQTTLFNAPKNIKKKFWSMVLENRPEQTEDEARQIVRQMRQSKIRQCASVGLLWESRHIRASVMESPELTNLINSHLWESNYGDGSESSSVLMDCNYHEFTLIMALLEDANIAPDSIKIYSI